jgi:hypothetical protein
VRGTSDDAPFVRIGAVDAVPYVGQVAFTRMVTYADSIGLVPHGDQLLGT